MKSNKRVKKIDNLLKDIHKFIFLHTKEEVLKLGLTPPRFHILWLLDKLQPINMTGLTKKAYMANSTLTVIIDALVKEELVERYRNPEDRREVLLEVTSNGESILNSIVEVRQKFLLRSLRGLDSGQQDELIELLTPILKDMEEDFENIKWEEEN
ncbi:MarR family transcriptional regulator [Natroniella sulfidigena]|uniref:MarR family winged helix-turn-helix transcriptional regulator n=1 Tax=Natroniella sulfidigena TaxID=723921 RepID=UPI00200B8D57|nr:MarR family transcriptional regulator [Natroniella sulfidigena]